MDAKVKLWVADLVGDGLAAEMKKADAQRRARQAVTDQMRGDVNNVARTLFAGANQKVTDGKTTQKMLDYDTRDQTNEFDLDEVNDGYQLLDKDGDVPGDALRRLAAAQNLIAQMKEKLMAGVDELDDDGKPVLDDKGNPKKILLYKDEKELNQMLSDELYEPLKRRGLLPETFIPDECSKSRQMIDGAFGEYKKRLDQDERKGKTGKFWQFVQENKGLGMSLVNAVGTGVSSKFQADNIKDLAGKVNLDPNSAAYKDAFSNQWNQFTDGKTSDRFKEAFTNVNSTDPLKANAARMDVSLQGMDIAFGKIPDAVDGILDDPLAVQEKLKNLTASQKQALGDAKVRKHAAGKLVDTLVFTAGTALADLVRDGGLDVSVSTLFTGRVKPAQLTTALAAVPFDPGAADTALTGFAAAFKATFVAADPKVGDSTRILTAAGVAMEAKFKTSVTGAGLAADLPDDLMAVKFEAVLTGLTNAVSAAADAAKSQDLTDLLKDEAVTDGVLDAAGKQIEADEQREMDDEEKEQARENEEYEKGGEEAKRSLIEKKIAALKRDQTIIKWGSSLAGMGFDLASKALAPLALAGSLMKIAQNLRLAIQRTRDFVVFMNNQMDAFRAASAYSAPIQNFIDNAAVQAIHYDMVTSIEVLRFIGLILETTGVPYAVVAGKAVQLAASVSSAVEGVLYEAKKRYDLHAAWKGYKAALLRPANRKLALVAMKQNPTLAKYAMAWGAVIEKDPLVADFMRKTGLDDRTLADPGSGVSEVQSYLEARFPDDNVVTGRAYPMADWAPKNPELTVLFWTTAKQLGEKKADLVQQDTKKLEAVLARFDVEFTAIEAKKSEPVSVLKPLAETAQVTLKELVLELKSYAPMRDAKPKPIPHVDMKQVAANMLELTGEPAQILEALTA